MRDHSELIVHKGVDNSLFFQVKDHDLRKVPMAGAVVVAKIINPENKEKVIEKYLEIIDFNTLKLEIFEGDLIDLGAGDYDMVLETRHTAMSSANEYYTSTPLFRNQRGDIKYSVEITDHGDSTPVPTIVMENPVVNWTGSRQNGQTTYVSSPIQCNAMKNHLNQLHTFSIESESFTGQLDIFGSLELQPPTMHDDWFPVPVMDHPTNKIEFEKFSNTHPFNVMGRISWVQMRLTVADTNTGTINKILWRS